MRESRQLVPLHRLAVFEVAARHGSFSMAARELGMTQSAVSHQIADLEAELGIQLFQRVWRGVTTTEAGSFLFEAARRGISEIAAAIEVARAMGRRSQLTVLTDFGFAAFWLLPRLAQLRDRLPDVDVRVITAQGAADLEGALADFAILFGAASWHRYETVRLVEEDVVPVASPGFLARHRLRSAADLAALPLLHLERPDPDRWLSWGEYMEGSGLRDAAAGGRQVQSGLSFNNYMLVLQAAIAGQGIALGWRPLTDDLLRQGLVAEAPLPRIRTGRGYHVITMPGRTQPSRTTREFKAWLMDEFDVGATPSR
jgi:putative choline sulfate-utilization transcription factor